MQCWKAWVCLTGALLVAGCSGRGSVDRPRVVPVRGRVLLGGEAVDGAHVTFYSEDQQLAAYGTTGSDGRFRLSTFGQHDGAVPGEHRVTVSKLASGEPGIESDDLREIDAETFTGYQQRESLIPASYSDPAQSGLTATVTEAGPNDFTFELVP